MYRFSIQCRENMDFMLFVIRMAIISSVIADLEDTSSRVHKNREDIQKPLGQQSKSDPISLSTISEEHPLEDYMYEENALNKQGLRSIVSACRRKVETFCYKKCRWAYKDLCEEYNCRPYVRRDFKAACKDKCFHYYA